jgi:hypothetical protein
VVDSAVTVIDADNATLASATVSITGNFHSGEDVLAFSNTDAATFGNITASYNAATGILSLTSSGASASVLQWQNALQHVTYDDTSDTPNTATRTVSFAANDGTASSAAVTKTVSVAAVNDPPVMTASGGTTAASEQVPIVVDSAVTVIDADNATLASATVSITGNFHSGEDVLAFSNTDAAAFGNITASYNAATGVLSLTSTGATASVTQWQNALQHVTYDDISDTPNTATRTVSFAANDGTASSAAVTKTVSVAAVNDPPVVTASGGATAASEQIPTVVDSAVTVTDADNATLASATVSITGNFHFAEDLLAFNNTDAAAFGNITASYNAATGVLSLTSTGATASVTQWQNALQHVTYDDTSDTPNTATRTVSFAANDGTANSTAVTKTVSVAAVNDPPVMTASGGTTAASEQVPVVVDSAVTVTDADNATLASAIVSITGNFHSGEDVLGFSNTDAATFGNITASYNPGTGVLTLTSSGASASVLQWQAALQHVTYDDTSDTPNTATRTVSFAANDGTASSATVTKTVSVAAVNDPPVVTAGNTVGYSEQAVAIVVGSALAVTDADSPNLAGATVAISAGLLAGDTLHFTNQNGISGSFASGVLTLSGSATVAQYQTALRSITFDNTTNDNPTSFGTDMSRTITWQVNDGSGFNNLSSTDTTTINVTAVNDAPVLHNVPAGAAFANGPAVTLAPGLTISDVDNTMLASATVHVSAGAFTAHGDVLSVSAADLAGTSIVANYNAASETLTLSGTDTLAHYSQALEHVAFQTTNFAADRAQIIEWQVNDGAAANNLSDVASTAISLPRAQTNDFNGNGHSAILWQNADGTPAVWSMNGLNVTAGADAGFNPGASWHEIGAGDFNGDGKADILWQNTDGTPAAWLMNGTNILSGANIGFNPGSSWHEIAAADFNGDGKADILWQNADGTPAIWLMNGLNVVSGANVGFNPGPSWHVIGAGDFDGDGKADILWQNSNGQAAVWLMDGQHLKAGGNVGFNPGPDWHVQATGDFNGDGKADILWQNVNGQAAIWEMNGLNLISGSNVGFNPGPAWQVHGTGDFNGDGKADIVWQNSDGTPAVWLMDGFNVVAGGNVGFDPGASWHVVPPHHDVLV